jgi:hypothetical protein
LIGKRWLSSSVVVNENGKIVLSMSLLPFSHHVALQRILTSVIASTIALLLCIIFVLSRPFFGPMAFQPEEAKDRLARVPAVAAIAVLEAGQMTMPRSC